MNNSIPNWEDRCTLCKQLLLFYTENLANNMNTLFNHMAKYYYSKTLGKVILRVL